MISAHSSTPITILENNDIYLSIYVTEDIMLLHLFRKLQHILNMCHNYLPPLHNLYACYAVDTSINGTYKNNNNILFQYTFPGYILYKCLY